MVNADFTVKIGGKFLVIQSFESLSCVHFGSSVFDVFVFHWLSWWYISFKRVCITLS